MATTRRRASKAVVPVTEEVNEEVEVEVVQEDNYTSEELSKASLNALRRAEPPKENAASWQEQKAHTLALLAVAAAVREWYKSQE